MPPAIDILMVDDSVDDSHIFQEALAHACPEISVLWVATGEEAMAFLIEGRELLHTCPAKLVVMDMNMPGLNGMETLRLIRESSVIGSVPVVMLSSCRSRKDVELAYELGANAFFKKPMSFDGYLEKVRILVQHWLRLAEVPYASKAIA
jgi:DNA-binding response OmpR family regulator